MHCPGNHTDLPIHKCPSVHIINVNPMSQLQSAAKLGPDFLGEPRSLSLNAGHTEEKRAGLKSVCSFFFLFSKRPQSSAMQVFLSWHHKILGHAAKSMWVEKKGGVLDSYKHLCFCSQGIKKEQTFPMTLWECKCHMSILANGRNGISCAVFTAKLSCPSYISCILSTEAYA